MTARIPLRRNRAFRIAGALVGLAVVLGACTNTGEVVTASVPNDYRLRHPIAIQEADRSAVIFVGHARGGLSASQRADVIGLAQTWLREGTGAIVADVPLDTPNARAAESAFREVRALLSAGGVPAGGITLRHYHAVDSISPGVINLTYPRIAAVAGPCGQWPEDLGPSTMNPRYSENKQYYNFGCANQRNLAAMIDNPADLVHPRPAAPASTGAPNAPFEKYRKGEPNATAYPRIRQGKAQRNRKMIKQTRR